MKLTVFQFEGTPEELDASQVLHELTQSHNGGSTVVRTSAQMNPIRDGLPLRIPGVPDEGQGTVRALLQDSPASELFVKFMRKTTSWNNVVVRGIKRKTAQPGAPLDYSRYLRLRKQGSPFGGFAYVYPEFSKINLRLNYTNEQLSDLNITTARTLTTGHREYRVSVDLKGDESLAEALRLAKLAYDAT
ncbi:hypothetical protein OHT68_49135 (plasmid) [Streptomyces canus]|uniref:hypothetical protein n=1 Tax=Streptomyces canus TaxID=58343 RepID=UPI002E296C03|nr:hypothetical protein [Streptomyces canus]